MDSVTGDIAEKDVPLRFEDALDIRELPVYPSAGESVDEPGLVVELDGGYAPPYILRSTGLLID